MQTTTVPRPAIAYVATGQLIADGRPHGAIEYDVTTCRTVNIWFYADGSAGLVLFRPSASEDAGVRVDIPAPMGDRLRAALFAEDAAAFTAVVEASWAAA